MCERALCLKKNANIMSSFLTICLNPDCPDDSDMTDHPPLQFASAALEAKQFFLEMTVQSYLSTTNRKT